MLPKGSSTLQNAEAAPVVNRSGVSFPVMAAFPHPPNSYVINQEIPPLQGIAPNDPTVQVYAPILPTKQVSSNYLQHRQPQKPCKRPRRYACQYAGCKSLKHHEAVWHNATGSEPTVEHDLREKIIRLQNRYRVNNSAFCDA